MSYLSDLIDQVSSALVNAFGMNVGGETFVAIANSFDDYSEDSPVYKEQIAGIGSLAEVLCEVLTNDRVTTADNIDLSSQREVMVVTVNTGATNKTVGLPALANARVGALHIVKGDSGAGQVIIEPDGAEEIAGSASITLSSQYDSATIWPAGTFWST